MSVCRAAGGLTEMRRRRWRMVGPAPIGSVARRWPVRRGGSGPLRGLVGLPGGGWSYGNAAATVADGWACAHRFGGSAVARPAGRVGSAARSCRSAGRRVVFTGKPQRGRRMAGPAPIGSGARRWRARRGGDGAGGAGPAVIGVSACGRPRPRPAALPPPCAGPVGGTATPSRPAGAGRSPMPVHPAMIANLWPRNTLTCDYKFAIDGSSRAESTAAERRPRRARHRRAPGPSTAGRTHRRPRRPSFPGKRPAARQTNKAAQRTRAAPPPRAATGEHPARWERASPRGPLKAGVTPRFHSRPAFMNTA
ncbi:hypothetical protein EKD16_24580 [Streptomonospora litoralis]|uniref:Uncharacterized protein n=1 Tax=Streptomonospora litoralis TaxID=2498135 RepID=A0A4P6Q8A3_9ACTN|nr:hypothetical protein EKD16_24580 [Streptomonospora litoralis]